MLILREVIAITAKGAKYKYQVFTGRLLILVRALVHVQSSTAALYSSLDETL